MIATLDWPQAIVRATAIESAALVLSVLVWSIFRTGRTAMSTERGRSTES